MRRTAFLGLDPTGFVRDGAYHGAFRTPEGPVAVTYRPLDEARVEAQAWGPGAARALDAAPAHLGADDRPEAFVTDDRRVGALARRLRGLRFGRSGRVLERLVPAILGQKVTGKGAARSFADLVHRHGERAPGPTEGLWLPPAPEVLASMSYADFHPLGVERRRAETILRVARRAASLERLAADGPDALEARLLAFRGVGPWTAALVRTAVFGDPDAVIVGDYNLPHLVAHALAGEARADDARMLALLEPFRPHRGRVVALLAASGTGAPRFGPRLPVRDIRGL